MSLKEAIEHVVTAIELAGIAIILIGIAAATVSAAAQRLAGGLGEYRQRVGRAMLLGLEFLVAAEIIRTVGVSRTFESIGVLALIVLVRTFLSFALELEIEGRWPWQRRA